jgi:hypothetical protein
MKRVSAPNFQPKILIDYYIGKRVLMFINGAWRWSKTGSPQHIVIRDDTNPEYAKQIEQAIKQYTHLQTPQRKVKE